MSIEPVSPEDRDLLIHALAYMGSVWVGDQRERARQLAKRLTAADFLNITIKNPTGGRR